MTALREVFARFGVEFDASALTQGNAAVDGLIGRVQTLGSVIAGAAVVQGIRSFAAEFVDVANEVEDTSAILGTSAQALQEWRLAAQLSGASAQAMDGALLRLSDQIGAGSPIFRRLGVDVRDSAGQFRAAGDVLQDLADPIAALPTDAERTAVLMDLLGRSGARLGPLFARGSAGIAEVRAELGALGGGATPEAIEAAGALGDAWDRLDLVGLSLKSRLAVFLLPAIERLSTAVLGAGAAFTRMTDRGRIAEVMIVGLGVAAVASGARTAAAWVAAAAPFVALAVVVGVALLVFEDLWIGIEGGRSSIGDLAIAMEEWGAEWSAEGGIMGGVIAAWEYLKGLIASTVNTVSQMAAVVGFGPEEGILGDAGESVAREGAPESALAGELIRRQREQAGAFGEFMVPDTTERFLGLQDARRMIESGTVPEDLRGFVGQGAGAARGAAQVSQTVRIDRIDTTGMTPAEAQRMVEGAIERALTSQADDTLDTLAQGDA